MEEELIKAGRIAAEALDYAKQLVKKDALLLELTEKTEDKIIKLGGKPAFPVQISLNHIAAHYCPDSQDKTTFLDQIVKIDVGVHVNGCIGDNACTIDLSGENQELVMASEQALQAAIKLAKPGTRISELGRAIHDAITAKGFAPVRNLSGHGLEKYDVHATPTIPNFDTGSKETLKEDQIIAIEPFASKGEGIVIETSNPTVFMLKQKKPIRDSTSREVLKAIEEYEGLPFAKRWLEKKFPIFKVNFALKQLINHGIIQDFPPLADRAKGLISQAEHTIIVKEKPIILTKLE